MAPSPRATRAGLIVAGGRSTRFGDADKALADLAGAPMVRRVADRLAPSVDAVVVNCRREQRPALCDALAGLDRPVTFAVDDAPDRGPMAGVRTGLAAVDAPAVAVVPCDVPFLESGLVRHLFDRLEGAAPDGTAPAGFGSGDPTSDGEGPVDAAIPRLGGGPLQPMQAVYRTRPMTEACDAALARGDRSVRGAIEVLDAAFVAEEELRTHGSLRTFENVNTREAFDAAAERIRSGPTADE